MESVKWPAGETFPARSKKSYKPQPAQDATETIQDDSTLDDDDEYLDEDDYNDDDDDDDFDEMDD